MNLTPHSLTSLAAKLEQFARQQQQNKAQIATFHTIFSSQYKESPKGHGAKNYINDCWMVGGTKTFKGPELCD